MAAAEVLVVENCFTRSHHQGTERIERILENWYKDLRGSIVSEFLQFKSSVEDEQERVIKEIKNKASPEVIRLRRETEKLRELLHTLERSVSQKDKLVSNLVKSLEKEKEKYEKLRAVSSDKLDQSAEESDNWRVEADRHFNKMLLERCWKSWKNATRSKQRNSENRTHIEATSLLTVKQEDQSGNDIILSDDGLLLSDSEDSLVEKSDVEFALETSTSDESERRSYPAFVNSSNEFNNTISISTNEDNSRGERPAITTGLSVVSINDANALDPVMGTVVSQSQTSVHIVARNRVRKRSNEKTSYQRGRKMYHIKDKIRIKKVQSLRTGAFLNSNDRPTMATNAFQAQRDIEDDNTVLLPSMASDLHRVSQSESYNNQNILIDPIHSMEDNPNPSASIVGSKPQFGSNQSEWEAAKNNISQYMNQMLIQGEAASKEQQRKTSETNENEDAPGVLSNQPSTSSTKDQKQNSNDGQICTECNEIIPPRSMQKHKKLCKRRNPTSNEKWTCKDCGKSFISGKRYLEDHIMSVHWGTSPYECEICGKGFASYNNYKRHLLVHSGDRPFECNICKKSFNQYCNLARHRMRIHNISKEEALFLNLK